jgi:hypothetical protein
MMTGSPLSTLRARQRVLSGLSATNPWVNAAVVGGSTAVGASKSQTGEQIAMMSVAGAGAIIGGFAASATAAGATTWATAAIPIVGPIIAGVTIALTILFNRKGPKQKVATTKIVDAVEPHLKDNVAAYLALPVHYVSAQQQALANFDAGWEYVKSQCNIPEMGNPGIACTADRQRGGRWDWFSYYRDPIANDTKVVADPTAVEQAEMQLNESVNVGGVAVPTYLLLAGGALALVLLMPSGGGGRR